MLLRAAGPGRQQPVQALELWPVQPVVALQVGAAGAAVVPPRRFGRRRRAAVAPVQADEVLRLRRRRRKTGELGKLSDSKVQKWVLNCDRGSGAGADKSK